MSQELNINTTKTFCVPLKHQTVPTKEFLSWCQMYLCEPTLQEYFDSSCAFVDVIKKGRCDVITVSVTGSSTLTVRADRGCEMKTSAEKLDFTVVHSM